MGRSWWSAVSRDAIRRSELLAEVTHSTSGGVGRGDLEQFVEKSVRAYLEQLAWDVLESGESVTLPGFGKFYRATWLPTGRGLSRGKPRHRLAFKAAERQRRVTE